MTFDSQNIQITLTKDEQRLILEHCQQLDSEILRKVSLSMQGQVFLTDVELAVLATAVGKNMPGSNPVTRSLVLKLKNVIDQIVDLYAGDEGPDMPFGPSSVFNEAAIEELGGLNTEQVARLIGKRWDDPDSPIKLNRVLTFETVNQTVFFRNARQFIILLSEWQDQPTATAAGNLNRKFVQQAFDAWELTDEQRLTITKYNKVINEQDFFPLHIVRIVCQCAGLIKKRKDRFTVNQKHAALLTDEAAGELYGLLFRTFFQEFNLSYLDSMPELEGIQATFGYTLYRLGVLCDSFQQTDALSEEVFLPMLLEEIDAALGEYMHQESLLHSRVIVPLQLFGLLECKHRGDNTWDIEQVRKTPLFDAFISIQF